MAFREHRTRTLMIVLIPILAVLITSLTGFWAPIQTYVFGFPFSWRGCVIIPTVLGGNACYSITYDPNFFLVDVAFYTAIGYGIVFLYTQLMGKQQDNLMDPGNAADSKQLHDLPHSKSK